MVLTTMMAVTACVLATGLLAAAHGPFDHAFAQQRGAHLNALVDPAKADPARLAATSRAPGVTAMAARTRLCPCGRTRAMAPAHSPRAPRWPR